MARFLFLFTLIIATNCFAQPGFGDAHKINNGWQFTLNSTDSVAERPAQGAAWQTVDLPHDWSVRQKLDPANASSMGYLSGGIGWYKKELVVPASNKKVYLYFEGVYNRSEVLVNGQSVGKRPNGYISFMYDITPYLKPGKPNEILVKADHHRDADSRWYTGSGIYRDVWLVYANPVHIAQWGVYAYPQVTDASAVLNIETAIENKDAKEQQLTVVQELVGPDKKIVGQSSTSVKVAANSLGKAVAAIKVDNPKLWSLKTPTLYTLRTKVLQAGKQIDASVTTTGFRKFQFDANKGFSLNDKWMKVKGVCLHHDAGVLGAAMYKDVWRRRLLNLKEVGVNAIRTSHNPQASALYELCDELGLLVMDEAFDEWEFPKRKWLEGWNAGTPGYQGTYDFFPEWGEKDLGDMVRRDRNHISIFAWSIGNEVDYPNDPYSHPVLDGGAQTGFTQKIFGGYKKDAPDAMRLGVIAKKLAAVVKQYDRSRPVTAGLAGVAMSNETDYPSALDIAGYNYTENRYNSDHKKYPNRVIFGSENRHDLSAWKAVTDNEHIFGQFLWTGIDYLGESGRWPSRGFYSGLLDFGGFIKPRGYFRQSLWSEKPVAYLGTYPVKGGDHTQDVLSQSEGRKEELSVDAWASWNYKEGQTIRVVCYTNTAKARLLLDNQPIGDVKNYDTKTGITYWYVPFKPGRLKVEGLNEAGNVVVTYAVTTAGEAVALQVINDSKKDDAVKQVAIQMVDAKGNPVYTANADITCTVSGGTLLGLEAGDNSDMGDYTDNVQKTFRGRLLAYVKKSQKSGPVKIVFTAPGLKSITVTL